MSGLSLSDFARKMNEVMPVIMKEFGRRLANELYKGKITLPQLFILEFLHREGESKMTALAHFMNVSTAAMTGIVERLVRDDYVLRAQEVGDRRIIKVRLTAQGMDLVKKIDKQKCQMVMRVFGKISEADRHEYLRILMQIKDILAKREKEVGK